MSEKEQQLLELLRERSFARGTFTLASGDTSTYYLDGRMTAVYSAGAYLIGEVLYERTRDLRIDGIGGLEVGAVPLATAAVFSYHLHGQEMEGFWVRDRAKAHGMRKVIEGGRGLGEGSRVAVVDDVITRGTATLKAVEEVRRIGCEVVLVTALVDRLAGAEELFRSAGIERYEPVFRITDFGVTLDECAPGAGTTG